MAAMLSAFARLVRERPPGSASVLLACTVDEEFTHIGSSRLAETNHGAELAIVAEPTLLNLVHCHKGALRWKIRTRGVACHSSTPAPGRERHLPDGPRSSTFCRSMPRTLAASTPDPILGPPTLSVGRIEGGQSVNVVPDWCEIEVDRRLIPGEDAASAMDTRASSCARGCSTDADCLELSQPWVHMPPLAPQAVAGSSRSRVRSTARRRTGRSVDGRSVRHRRRPAERDRNACVVFGPGDIAQAHTKDEWIELEQVQLAAAGVLSDRRRSGAIAACEAQTTRPRRSSEGEDGRGLGRAA